MVRFVTFSIACLLLFSLVSCSKKEPDPEMISRRIGVNVADGNIEVYTEDYSGPLGDGERYAKIVFSDEAFYNQVKENGEWSKMPLSQNLHIVVYGGGGRRTFISDENGQPLIPTISDGYYFFKDRHSESENEKDDSQLFDRYSYNFTLAIYDSESKTLHFFEYDS